jgi:hypothetical protein
MTTDKVLFHSMQFYLQNYGSRSEHKLYLEDILPYVYNFCNATEQDCVDASNQTQTAN